MTISKRFIATHTWASRFVWRARRNKTWAQGKYPRPWCFAPKVM